MPLARYGVTSTNVLRRVPADGQIAAFWLVRASINRCLRCCGNVFTETGLPFPAGLFLLKDLVGLVAGGIVVIAPQVIPADAPSSKSSLYSQH